MQQDETKGKLYTKEEAAEILHVSPITIHRQIKAGKLGFYRLGSRVLISPRHIDDFLTRCERPPKSSRAAA
jgi:excisionase family DNA binding protein